MAGKGIWLAAAGAMLSLGYWFATGSATAPVAPALAAPRTHGAPQVKVEVNPERTAWFGDLHLHTANSFDAYTLMGTRTTPDEAYKFARGDTINYLGQPIRKDEPLDFLAVTDHAENIGVFNQLDDPDNALSKTDLGQLLRKGGHDNFFKAMALIKDGASLGDNPKGVSASTWQREMETANANYQPGKFTTFIAYEWTSNPSRQNLHRNVIFRGNTAPSPFTANDSDDPAQLWAWLTRIRGQGFEALAIPHNGNVSNGLMFDWVDMKGKPIDEAYAQMRATNEPLFEVSQNKGTSETHPALSSNDEFAGFEIYKWLLGENTAGKLPGSYWRDGLGRGLVLGAKLGTNPYKYGAVGAGDLHSGLSASSERDYASAGRANLGGGRLSREQFQAMLDGAKNVDSQPTDIITSGAALTGVWAESNTRESIYDALRRKESFATSGTRIKVRFFGGWNFASGLVARPDWVKTAYARGVPMGGDLPLGHGGAPAFAIEAVKDPHSGNLDRVQIIKVWLENGAQRERVFDVAWSGGRRIDRATGKLAAVGDTVDLKTGKYRNDIGAARLSTVWHDPVFKANQAAVYYVRVLEIPTPRWSTLRAIEFGLPISKAVPATIQERAWSSPIWYSPARRH